jgi:hypothetical protein
VSVLFGPSPPSHDNRNDFGDRTELRGTYATEALAKAAAKRDLLDEWDREFFELYKEDYDGHRGVYDVYAEFPEGEAMGVYNSGVGHSRRVD